MAAPQTKTIDKSAIYVWDDNNKEFVALKANSSGELDVREESATDFEGAPVTVGTTAVEITFSGQPKAILIQSHPDNSGYIWIGKGNIDNAGANAIAILSPGGRFRADYDDSSNAIYAVSDTASQTVYKAAML